MANSCTETNNMQCMLGLIKWKSLGDASKRVVIWLRVATGDTHVAHSLPFSFPDPLSSPLFPFWGGGGRGPSSSLSYFPLLAVYALQTGP